MQTRGGRPKGTWQLCACQDSVCIFRSDHVFESSPASLAPPPPYSIAQTTLLKLLCCEAPRCSSCLAARQQAGHHKNLTPSSSGVLPLNSLRWAHSNKAGRAFFWGLWMDDPDPLPQDKTCESSHLHVHLSGQSLPHLAFPLDSSSLSARMSSSRSKPASSAGVVDKGLAS